MSAEEVAWQDLKQRFDVDLGETELGKERNENTVSILWRVTESKFHGQSKVEFKRACDGKLHMLGAAAVVYENGDKLFYQNGFLHNAKGPAKIMHFNGRLYEEYYLYGMLTGTNGLAIGIHPKQLPTIPHLPGEPTTNMKDSCWK